MASELRERIQGELREARKARDRERTLVLSTLLSEFRNREIELGRELGEDDALAVVSRGIKQRRDAAAQMEAAGRAELAARERIQAEILQAFLPRRLEEAEVRALVREIVANGAQGIGPVMGQLMPRIRGRFDGQEANRIVREELGG